MIPKEKKDNDNGGGRKHITESAMYSALERPDEEWFAIMHRCGNVTCKAACGTSYERVTGKRFPIESYRKWEASLAKKTSCWRGVWLSAADYAAAPEWAKRYCEHNRWVEYIGKDELADGKDGRKTGRRTRDDMNDLTVQTASDVDSIRARILTIRGVQVMLDRDLAVLYGVPTKRLNEQVKRNMIRFPPNASCSN